uniref:endosome-associated-trafficking regulator 1 isoform X2 n=1 Tax=Scatophagus argus TaxID=75038 RepID=UPI001ED83A33|nr:endosome-associated-trafficking regulator 1 isoform X2 [Scatophagus argus]
MSTQRSSAKTLIITDDEEVEAEELNPFSFREFLRWKNQDPDLDQDLDQEHTHSKSSSSQRSFDVGTVTFDPAVSFFSEAPQEQEEDDDWGQSFQSGVDSTSSVCTEEEDEEQTRFSSKPEVQRGGGGAGAGGENYEGDDETSIAEPVTSCRRRSGRSQIQQLKEENVSLRRTIRELQRRSEASERRVLELSEELFQRRRQEEKEAQDLESMVHSVEQNLHLMTRRAVKAENCVSKLKVELQQLQVCVYLRVSQVEIDSLRSENDSLKAAESELVVTMRQNAQVASEYLNKTASHAQSSIRQLLGEAETLRLVSQLLQYIDKISNLSSDS